VITGGRLVAVLHRPVVRRDHTGRPDHMQTDGQAGLRGHRPRQRITDRQPTRRYPHRRLPAERQPPARSRYDGRSALMSPDVHGISDQRLIAVRVRQPDPQVRPADARPQDVPHRHVVQRPAGDVVTGTPGRHQLRPVAGLRRSIGSRGVHQARRAHHHHQQTRAHSAPRGRIHSAKSSLNRYNLNELQLLQRQTARFRRRVVGGTTTWSRRASSR
jgi:hypothetical protein